MSERHERVGAIFGSTPALSSLASDGHADDAHVAAEVRKKSWWKPSGRHESHQSGRAASIRTTSTVSSANTAFSKASNGSQSTAASSVEADCVSPISPTSPGYYLHAIENASDAPVSALASLTLNTPDATDIPRSARSAPPDMQQGTSAGENLLPIASPRHLGSRTESRLGHRPETAVAKQPLAEVEMMPRKYAGYWRASFTADLPISAAMCGCLLMVAGPGESAKWNVCLLTLTTYQVHRAVRSLLRATNLPQTRDHYKKPLWPRFHQPR